MFKHPLVYVSFLASMKRWRKISTHFIDAFLSSRLSNFGYMTAQLNETRCKASAYEIDVDFYTK